MLLSFTDFVLTYNLEEQRFYFVMRCVENNKQYNTLFSFSTPVEAELYVFNNLAIMAVPLEGESS